MIWTAFKMELLYEFNKNPTNSFVSDTYAGGRNDGRCLNNIIFFHFVKKA